ncbi:hypothetical protein MHBO_004397 [Bonamia ostreae]|uniref:Endonuclease/exonuclease/phosphatase domain-containing protein n=1 Tax=Bonamia ostreae TaxID=126728 RepID=A0ABV2ATE3_9EUKA
MADKFKILTWNVWFSDLCVSERMRQIVAEIKLHNPHVFCLQEVTFENLEHLLSNLAMEKLTQYKTSTDLCYHVERKSAYFNLIFSRLDFYVIL